MFHYLHCYHPQTWDAQVKAGLINDNAGIRFCESIDIDENLKFNTLARVGGELYEILRERGCPFYIDRLQGGCYIENYPYDMALVDTYRKLLGGNFWGFQMHEWMSNYKGDLDKLARNGCSAWTAEAITETIRRAYPFSHTFLEAMTAEEFEETGKPDTMERFIENADALFAKRQSYTGGSLVPCDSYYLSYPIELRHGAKRLMPEIGAQTPDTRIQVAYARGMAKAYGIPFGTYYEPWGGSPFSACCYQKDGRNEWNIGEEDFPFRTCGGNGGSSRSMQRRLHLYSYIAGASFMAEEWGMCNTFYDWRGFELTPYGEIKRDFIRFTEKYPDIGTLMTPIAVVLPETLPMLVNLGTVEKVCREFPMKEGLRTEMLSVKTGLETLFRETAPMIGSERESLLNSSAFDALDIVNEDCLRADDYAYLVDLTGKAALHSRFGDKVVSAAQVPELLDRLLPCRAEGPALKLVSRREDGVCYLMLLNNSGVQRSVAEGERLDHTADAEIRVTVKDGRPLTALEGDGKLARNEDGSYTVTVPAGGWFFGRF